jgi:hypothetical protein
MRLLALSCRFNTKNSLSDSTKNNNYFFGRKRKKRRKKRKKKKRICKFKSNEAAAVKVFWKNTTRSVAEVWRFFQKPGGLDLYCR